jgi:hypothetical protein
VGHGFSDTKFPCCQDSKRSKLNANGLADQTGKRRKRADATEFETLQKKKTIKMPSLIIPEFGLSLNSGLSPAKPDLPHSDIFTLTLADSVIEDMIKCVRNGKPIQLSLGNEPVSEISFCSSDVDCH